VGADPPASRLSHTPAWLIVPEQLLDNYLLADFGARDAGQIALRQLAVFDKPGVQTRAWPFTRSRDGLARACPVRASPVIGV
jgi:hypothetical protein